MKISVNGGHTPAAPGASGYLNEVTEDRKIRDALISELKSRGHSVNDSTSANHMGVNDDLVTQCNKANASGAELGVSIHLNAGGGTGVEVLYYPGDSTGKKYAEKVSANLASTLGLPNRGAKSRSDLYWLNCTNMTAILVEVCFVDSPTDANAYKRVGAAGVAKAIANAIVGGSSSSGGAAKVNKQVPGSAVNNIGFYYRAHVSNLGWLDCVRDGQVAGTTGNGLQLEAFKITPPSGVTLNVHAHISNVGWKTYKGVKKGVSSGNGSSANDPIIGTTGKCQAIEAFAVDVVENTTGKKLYYRCHMSGVGWCGWIPAPYAVGTVGCAKAIEAIQFKMV